MKTLFSLLLASLSVLALSPAGYAQDGTTCLQAISIDIDSCKKVGYYVYMDSTKPDFVCVNSPESEGWASFTVPAGANRTIYITANTYIGSAGLGVQALSGSCSSLNQIACVNNVSGNMFQIETMTLPNLSPGAYYLRLTNDNGTFSGGATLCITASPVGISENSNGTSVNIYPNPFSTQTTLSFPNEAAGFIKLTSMLGQEAMTRQFTGREVIIEKGQLSRGIYFLQIALNNHIINKRIVIE